MYRVRERSRAKVLQGPEEFGAAVTAGEGASTEWQDLEVVAASILMAREERWGKWLATAKWWQALVRVD